MKRKWCIAGIVMGALLMLSPVIGVVFGMTGAFRTLEKSGISNPQALSEGVGTTLISTAVGVLLCPVGIAILTISIIFLVRQRGVKPPPLPPQPPV